MSKIILVHGAFADHHAFDAVAPLLAARGHEVVAPDLPGHGADTTPLAQISLDTYVDAIARRIAAERDVVLVGHSMAGMVVSQVAEREPERVRALVYVAAYLPQNGQSLQQIAETDAESLVGKNMVFSPDWSTVEIKKQVLAEAIGADLSKELQKILVESQKPEPLRPFQGKVTLTPERFGRVRKAYLRTTEDRAVSPALQERMIAALPGLPVRSIATSHLPFLARPEEFVSALEALVEGAR